MYKKQIKKINEDIERTQKAIIGLGCSFVQGQGAFNEEIVKRYGTRFLEIGEPLQINKITQQEKKELLKLYPSLELDITGDEINFTFMEYENAFTNVLAQKYFKGEYASINFGQRGCGNRATIKELYLYPEIHWDKLEEVIVIYCPSGLERFDFINDQMIDHNHFLSMWPHEGKTGPRGKLWDGYREALYSDKFEVLEQILHVQELLTWCKLHNGKLIITPAFDLRYNKDYFYSSLSMTITRDLDGTLKKNDLFHVFKKKEKDIDHMVNLFPWENIFCPDGMPSFADMALKQEFNHTDHLEYHFWSFLQKGTPDNWITPCAHPSAKAHDLFAKLLYEHLIK